jgi:hypothetical protein
MRGDVADSGRSMRARHIQHKPCGARLLESTPMNRAPQAEAVMHDIEALRATMKPVTLEEDAQEDAFTKTR